MKHTKKVTTRKTFRAIIAALEKHYGKPAPPKTTDPLEQVIYENIAYLVTDEKRVATFNSLNKKIGLKPTQILAADTEQLINILRSGGVRPELRAARLKEIAQIALNEFDGDLNQALKLPLPKAKRALQKFPSIGAPGAEKILLFSRAYPVLGLESNGLRVLLRIGYGEEKKSYSGSYAAVQEELKDQIDSDCEFLIRAHQLLRQHGKELCRNSNPACDICPLKACCDYYQNNTKI